MLPGLVRYSSLTVIAAVASALTTCDLRLTTFARPKSHLHLTALVDEDVRGFDVAVDDALAVGRMQGIGDLDRNLEEGLGIQRAPRYPVLQRGAIQVLHHDEWLALVLSDLINRADVGMIRRRGGTRFAPEPLQALSVLNHVRREELERYETAKFYILCFVHDTHPAAAQLLDDAIVRDGLANHRAPLADGVARILVGADRHVN